MQAIQAPVTPPSTRYRLAMKLLSTKYSLPQECFGDFCRRFYENQAAAARTIFTTFKTREQLYTILIGQMQSGKTGAFHALIRLMFLSKLIDRTYILCGSNEVELYKQAKLDALAYNSEYYVSGALQVIFRQDFHKLTMNTSNALIVIDESHLDQTRNQQLDRLLERHNIVLSGTNRVMEANNTYILSVSATPFSEYSDVVHNVGHMDTEGTKKKVVRLEPSSIYRGVKYFLENGLIRPTTAFNLKENPAAFFRWLREKGNKYALMRVQDTKGFATKTMIRTLDTAWGIKVLNFMSGKEDIKLSALANAPLQPTIVLLAGRLRCGKVVPKEHISCVWEGSKAANTDTILQGLLGRMCGNYNNTPLGDMPVVFLPPSTLKQRRYIRDCKSEPIMVNELERYVLGFGYGEEDEGAIMPTLFMNAACDGSRTSSSHSRYPTLPLLYNADTIMTPALLSPGTPKNAVFDFLRDSVPTLAARLTEDFMRSPNYTDSQKREVEEFLSQPVLSCDIAPRWIDQTTQAGWRNQLHRSVEVGRMLTSHALEGKKDGAPHRPVLGLVYDDHSRKVFIQFQLKSESATPLCKRVNLTTGREVFAKPMLDSEAELPKGDGFIQSDLPLTVRTDPAAWEAALEELITRYLRSAAGGPIHDYNTISGPLAFSREAYGWAGHFAHPGGRLNVPPCMKDIHARLGQKYNVEIKVAYNSETKLATDTSTEHFYAASVVWVCK